MMLNEVPKGIMGTFKWNIPITIRNYIIDWSIKHEIPLNSILQDKDVKKGRTPQNNFLYMYSPGIQLKQITDI